MMRPTATRSALACVAALASLMAGGCFSERTHAGPIGPGAGACTIPIDSPIIGTTTALVAVRGFSFQPASIRVKAGTTVTWINCEPAGIDAHTSTSDAGVWESPFLEPGATYSHTFGAAGSFDYHCVPHPFMRGVVVVE